MNLTFAVCRKRHAKSLYYSPLKEPGYVVRGPLVATRRSLVFTFWRDRIVFGRLFTCRAARLPSPHSPGNQKLGKVAKVRG